MFTLILPDLERLGKKVRPLPMSGMPKIAAWISCHDFEEVFSKDTPDEKDSVLVDTLKRKVEEIFPTKEIKVFDYDKEFMDHNLQKIRRAKAREYRKRKRSKKYQELNRIYQELKRKNSEVHEGEDRNTEKE